MANKYNIKYLLGNKANDVTAQYVKINVERLAPIINQL